MNRRAAIIDGVFHAVPGNEQRMIGEPHHRPHANHLGDRMLDHLTGVLVDNLKYRRDVLPQGLGFRPPGERFRHRVQKRHPALAVSRNDGIANTEQGDFEPFALLARCRLRLSAPRYHCC